MHTTKRFETDQWLSLRFAARCTLALVARLVGFGLLFMGHLQSTPAQDPAHPTFASAEQASRALFAAVQKNDIQAITRTLGDEGLVLSGDDLEDKHERERFVQKYQQMHRLVREPDGTTVLYIGAENWPFPVPLVSKRGQWFFDPDAGAQEILFRTIGENESTAIKTRQALVLVSGNKERTNINSSIARYARNLVNGEPTSEGTAPASSEEPSGPFHGYYLRKLNKPDQGSNVSSSTTRRVVWMAYPADYRSSGVMTFIVTPQSIVYEKDLGPNTARIARATTAWKPDSSWHVAD